MNLPNLLTISRVAMLVLIVWLLHQSWTGAATLAWGLGLVACATDWLDGYAARRLGQVTNLGKLLDAFIDKILVLGVFAAALHPKLDLLPAWALAPLLLVFARDALITGLRALAARRGLVLGADRWGKRKTIWQMTALCVLLTVPVLRHDWPQRWPGSGGEGAWLTEWFWWMGLLLLLYSSFLAIYSGILYVAKYVPMLWQAKTDRPTP